MSEEQPMSCVSVKIYMFCIALQVNRFNAHGQISLEPCMRYIIMYMHYIYSRMTSKIDQLFSRRLGPVNTIIVVN